MTEAKWETGTDPDQLLTEDFAAMMFATRWGNKLAYCHDHGAWAEFDGHIWRFHREPKALQYARELAREISARQKGALSMQKTTFSKGVEKFAQGDPVFSRTADHWDQDPFLLGTPLGVVNLENGRFRASMPGDYITKATSVPPSESVDCPNWLQFLSDTTGGDASFIRFLQQICGYSLTGDTREHSLFFIYGPGGNGKSVFLNVLTQILGDYATTAAMDSFTASKFSGIPADLAMMRGARLVTASETEEGRAWAEARIKQITGGDPVTARFMRQNFFTFQPTFKLVIVGNHKPDLRQVDEAARRRFNIIPFTVKPTRPDRDLSKKLTNEAPGILRWMIEGCLDWQASGLTVPDVVTEATKEYFEDQDVFAQWLDEFCEVDMENPYISGQATPLYKSWHAFAKSVGFDSGSIKGFSQLLAKRGFKKSRASTGVFFQFIQLNQTETRDG